MKLTEIKFIKTEQNEKYNVTYAIYNAQIKVKVNPETFNPEDYDFLVIDNYKSDDGLKPYIRLPKMG